MDTCQTRAAQKSFGANGCQPISQSEARQAGAILKRIDTDACHRIGESDTGQARATAKGVMVNACNTIRNDGSIATIQQFARRRLNKGVAALT